MFLPLCAGRRTDGFCGFPAAKTVQNHDTIYGYILSYVKKFVKLFSAFAAVFGIVTDKQPRFCAT